MPTRPVIYNAAAVCADGRCSARYRKRVLPNYAVFDEHRYFTPGADAARADPDRGRARSA